MFYVYIHRKKSCGTPFYIGKGKLQRAFSSNGRSALWKRTVKKYGYIVEIYEKDIQEWYAFELEKELIALYGRFDLGQGTLVNFTDGGEGVSGVVQSASTKLLRSASSLSRCSTLEFKKEKSTLMTRLASSVEFCNKRNKAIQEAHNLKIIRDDGVVYDSIRIAADDVKISASHICKVLKKKRNKAGGYSWKYFNESLV